MARITIGTPQRGQQRGGGGARAPALVTQVVGAATNIREQDFIGPGNARARGEIAKIGTVTTLISGAAAVVDAANERRNILNEQDDNVQAQKGASDIQRNMQLIFNEEVTQAESNNRDVSADTLRKSILKRTDEFVAGNTIDFSTDRVRRSYDAKVEEMVKNNKFQLTISDELEKYTVNRVKDGLDLTANSQIDFLGSDASTIQDLQAMEGWIAGLFGSEMAASVYGVQAAGKGIQVQEAALRSYINKTVLSKDIGAMNAVERLLADPEKLASLSSDTRIVALSKIQKGRDRAIQDKLDKEKDATIEFQEKYVRETNKGVKTSQQINDDFNKGRIDYSTFTRAMNLNNKEEKKRATEQGTRDFVRNVLSGGIALRPKGSKEFSKKEDKLYDSGVQSQIEKAQQEGANSQDIEALQLGFVKRTGYVTATDRRRINDGVALSNEGALILAVKMVVTDENTYSQFEPRTQDAVNYVRRGLEPVDALQRADDIAKTTPQLREEREKNLKATSGQVGDVRTDAVESILETAGIKGFGEGFAGLGFNLDAEESTQLAQLQIGETFNLEYLRLGDAEQAKISTGQIMGKSLGINPDTDLIESLPPTTTLYGGDEDLELAGEAEWNMFSDNVRHREAIPGKTNIVRRIIPRTIGSANPEYQLWGVTEDQPDFKLRRGTDNQLVSWKPNRTGRDLSEWQTDTKVRIEEQKIEAARAKLAREKEIKGIEEVRIQKINKELMFMPVSPNLPGATEAATPERLKLLKEKIKLIRRQEAREKAIIQGERENSRKNR